MTPTDRMMQVGEAFSDFVLPEGFVNDPQGRVEHLTMAYRVALETALEDPISTAESPATGDNRRRARRIRNC
jgi:hypothetical protein